MENRLPTLASAIRMLEPNPGNGLCFHLSAALCYDLPKSKLVIGVFNPNIEAVKAEGGETDGLPFYHCWVEYYGNVLAPTTIERVGRLQPMERTGYYNINGVSKFSIIPRSKLFDIFKRKPELLQQLKFGLQPRKDGLLVDNLMKAAKLSFIVNETGGVVPNG